MNRIKELREEKGLSMRDVANGLGLPYTTYVNYEKGYREPNSEVLVSIADFYHVTVDYLLGKDFTVPRSRNILPMPEMHRIPLLGKIACGMPILAKENFNEYVDIPKNIQADFALECKGDSMIGARIHDGDIVYIHQQPDVESGEIAAVLIDGDDATLKRVRKLSGKIVLLPENPEYEPLVFVDNEINELKIIGKAVAFTGLVK